MEEIVHARRAAFDAAYEALRSALGEPGPDQYETDPYFLGDAVEAASRAARAILSDESWMTVSAIVGSAVTCFLGGDDQSTFEAESMGGSTYASFAYGIQRSRQKK